MKIFKIESHPYELKFNTAFKTAKSNYEHRVGAIIKIYIDDLIGLGEVAPLSGFHDESLLECYYALEAINQTISKQIILKTIVKIIVNNIVKIRVTLMVKNNISKNHSKNNN